MIKFILPACCLFLTINLTAQTAGDSSLIFENARGTLKHPLSHFRKVPAISVSDADKHLLPKMLSYYGNHGDSVTAVFDGTVTGIHETGGAYLLVTSYGNYSIGYFGMAKPFLKEGSYVRKGQLISTLTKSYGVAFLTLQFYKDADEVDPREWIVP